METSQYVNEASPEEADLIRRIVEVKDRIVRLAPGFVEDAEGFRAELRPHNLDIYVKPDDFLEEECDRIAADNWHNVGVACAFASRWGLPVEPTPNVDPSYLADRPFSGAPQIGGTAMAVTEGKEHLPLLRLDIDVRFDADEILNRVRERVGQAKAEWRSGGGDCYEKPSKLCKKLEKM
ncbi:hypothetical protein K8I85_00030, partial [bacterium]|nr:hypothetical protein [bacterium]